MIYFTLIMSWMFKFDIQVSLWLLYGTHFVCVLVVAADDCHRILRVVLIIRRQVPVTSHAVVTVWEWLHRNTTFSMPSMLGRMYCLPLHCHVCVWSCLADNCSPVWAQGPLKNKPTWFPGRVLYEATGPGWFCFPLFCVVCFFWVVFSFL